MLDPPPAMFDRAELIGEGQQARLDIAIDEAAKRLRYEWTPRPVQMPGQLDMGG